MIGDISRYLEFEDWPDDLIGRVLLLQPREDTSASVSIGISHALPKDVQYAALLAMRDAISVSIADLRAELDNEKLEGR